MNTEEMERGGGTRGEQDGTGQPRDIPPQHDANEAAALQGHLVKPHQGARRAGAVDEHRRKGGGGQEGNKREPGSCGKFHHSPLPTRQPHYRSIW